MIAQWIKEEGRQEGRQEGFQQGNIILPGRQFRKKFHQDFDECRPLLDGLRSEDLLELGEYMLDCVSVDELRSDFNLLSCKRTRIKPILLPNIPMTK